ncbi:MAG TPA: hypothetical protein VED17_02110 [Nitrososphaerales archaeon]|nr:hypothetical protein [Nitrososphaerales archaeon]
MAAPILVYGCWELHLYYLYMTTCLHTFCPIILLFDARTTESIAISSLTLGAFLIFLGLFADSRYVKRLVEMTN